MKKYIFLFLCSVALLPAGAQRHVLQREGRVVAHGLRFDPDAPVTDDMPEMLREMLQAYKTRPRYAERQKGRAVAPLLQSVRHQDDPFNRSCPRYTYSDGTTSTERCLVGCVATCIEQVLSYYRYPEALADTLHGWQTPNYRVEDVMPGTPIDWDNIRDDYRQGYTDREAQAVADLSLYCGIAARMNWGLSSSGASLSRAFEPLWRAFSYGTVVFLPRALYSTPAWNAMLRRELEQGRPVCYTGHNMALSGHAFNIDGVDENGYYHLNWGYGGDYDGYFDLDYLNPFEALGDATETGRQEGFFSNQTAMFLHPEDIDIDFGDTLSAEAAFAGVRVDTVCFRRQPDTQGYVVADLSMTNTTADTLNFTFEVFTYLPTDTAVFQQADYVALSAVNLAPGESRTWPVYCHFSRTGERIFALSADDETMPYAQPIYIEEGTPARLTFGQPDCLLRREGDELLATVGLDVSNAAAAGASGDLVTFCLFPDGSDTDLRHWEVLSLLAGETRRLTTTFRNLTDGQTYTLRVRCPWTVQQETTFTVRSEDAADGITPHAAAATATDRAYDLSGRPLPRARGLYIRNGKKYFIR